MKGDEEFLYPKKQRERVQDREERKWKRIESRPYRVECKVNYGRGTELFTEYFRTELFARLHAWLHSIRSRPEYTRIIIFKNREKS